MIEVALAAAVVAATCTIPVAAITQRSWLRRQTRTEVLVTTKEDQTFRGVLERVDREGLTLDAAHIVGVDETMAGRIWIPRGAVRWVQTTS